MAGIVAMKDNIKLFVGTSSILTLADKVGKVANIGDVSGDTEDVDTTTLESMAREYENGFETNGNIEITLNLTNDEYTTFNTYKNNGTNVYFGLAIFTKGSNPSQVLGLSGQGQVKTVTLTGMSVGGLIQVNVSIRVSGAIAADFVAPTEVAKAVTAISVAGYDSATTVNKLGTLQMVANVTPSDATNKSVAWGVSDGTKASINADGILSGIDAGSVTVYALAQDGSGVIGSTAITVTE